MHQIETVMHDLLQILWHLLHVRPGVSVIGLRVQEIFTVCLQKREQWPQVFNSLMKNVPGKVAEQLKSLNAEQHVSSRAERVSNSAMTSWWNGAADQDRKILAAYQHRKDRCKQQVSAKHAATRGMLPNAVQRALEAQADARDAADLKAILLVRFHHSKASPMITLCVARHSVSCVCVWEQAHTYSQCTC